MSSRPPKKKGAGSAKSGATTRALGEKRPRTSPAAEKAAGKSRVGRAAWVFGALGVVVLVVLGVAIISTRGDSGGSGVQVGVEGDELPTVESPQAVGTAADQAMGRRIPTVQGKAIDDSPMVIPADGKPKVIVFLAHWCPHCQAEVPRIQQWINTFGVPPDVELYAVSTAADSNLPNYPAGDWLQREGWTVRTLLDNSANGAAAAYGVSGFPFFVVVGPDGTVVTRASGELSIEQWEALIEAARTGQAAGASGGGPASPVG